MLLSGAWIELQENIFYSIPVACMSDFFPFPVCYCMVPKIFNQLIKKKWFTLNCGYLNQYRAKPSAFYIIGYRTLIYSLCWWFMRQKKVKDYISADNRKFVDVHKLNVQIQINLFQEIIDHTGKRILKMKERFI